MIFCIRGRRCLDGRSLGAGLALHRMGFHVPDVMTERRWWVGELTPDPVGPGELRDAGHVECLVSL